MRTLSLLVVCSALSTVIATKFYVLREETPQEQLKGNRKAIYHFSASAPQTQANLFGKHRFVELSIFDKKTNDGPPTASSKLNLLLNVNFASESQAGTNKFPLATKDNKDWVITKRLPGNAISADLTDQEGVGKCHKEDYFGIKEPGVDDLVLLPAMKGFLFIGQNAKLTPTPIKIVGKNRDVVKVDDKHTDKLLKIATLFYIYASACRFGALTNRMAVGKGMKLLLKPKPMVLEEISEKDIQN
jgi:hypothetical protein